MADRWTLTVRNGPRVEHLHLQTLGAALDALEQRLEELTPSARRRARRVAGRRFDPARQVAVRAEITGPGRLLRGPRGGVDLRGDGSMEAYTGRFKRTVVRLRREENAYAGLRRELQQRTR